MVAGQYEVRKGGGGWRRVGEGGDGVCVLAKGDGLVQRLDMGGVG